MGTKTSSLLASIAEFESDIIAERTSNNLYEFAENGSPRYLYRCLLRKK